MVAKGLYNFPYPPAHGCDARLTQYCAEACPTDPAIARDPAEAFDSPKTFLARKIVRIGGGGGAGGGGQGRSWAWGCFPRGQLVTAPPPRYAKLKQPKLSRHFFCGTNASAGPTDWQRAAAVNARMHDDLEAIANVCEVSAFLARGVRVIERFPGAKPCRRGQALSTHPPHPPHPRVSRRSAVYGLPRADPRDPVAPPQGRRPAALLLAKYGDARSSWGGK